SFMLRVSSEGGLILRCRRAQVESSMEDAEVGAGGEPIEVRIIVKDRGARSHTRSRDQTIEGLADSHPGAPSLPIESGSQAEVVQGLQAQDGEIPQVRLGLVRMPLVPEALQHFPEDHISQRDRSAILEELDATASLRC